jgi:hypothetical protein
MGDRFVRIMRGLVGVLLLGWLVSACVTRPNVDPSCKERGELEIGWLFDGSAVCPTTEGAAIQEVRVKLWRQAEDGSREALHLDGKGDVYKCAAQTVVFPNSLCGVYVIQVSAALENGRVAWNSSETVHRIKGGLINSVRVGMRPVN